MSNQRSGLVVSGFIEAEEVELAMEIGGRLAELPFAEGDEVAAGDVVARLDASVLLAQRQIAEAQVDLAQAQRNLLAAGVRAEIIVQARAQVAAAEAAVNAAQVALNDAAALRNNPQDLRVQLIDAETQVGVAQQQAIAAQNQFEIARQAYDSITGAAQEINDFNAQSGTDIPLPIEAATAPYLYAEAEANLRSAQEALEGSNAYLAGLRDLINNPQQLQIKVAETAASLEAAQAALARTTAELASLEAGPRSEDLAIADAQIAEAQAALDVIDAQLERFTLRTPIGGLVMQQALHAGEVATPAVPLVTIGNLDVVELTVYVTPDQFGQIALNQEVPVSVNSFPGRRFDGVVVQIADEAEFTPRNVQTQEERVNLVYAVKIRIENPDHVLKPGMPADASLGI